MKNKLVPLLTASVFLLLFFLLAFQAPTRASGVIIAAPAATVAADAGQASATAPAHTDQGVIISAVAPAAAVPDPGADGMGFAKAILTAFQSKNWAGVGALGLIGIVWLLRMLAGKVKQLSWFTGDRGGAVLVLVTSVAGALFSALVAGKTYSVELLLASVYMGVMAAGGWTLAKRLMGTPSSSDEPSAKS